MKKTFNNKIGKIVVVVISCLLFVVIFALLPDLLYHIRCFLKNIPGFNFIISEQLSDSKYIELMIIPLFNCITIGISAFALHTAKSSAETQEIQRNARIITASSHLYDVISNHLTVINGMKGSADNINNLTNNDSSLEDAAYLYTARRINKSQLLFIKEFIESVKYIKRLYNNNQIAEKNEKINDFCNKYFIQDRLEYTNELQDLVRLLKEIE